MCFLILWKQEHYDNKLIIKIVFSQPKRSFSEKRKEIKDFLCPKNCKFLRRTKNSPQVKEKNKRWLEEKKIILWSNKF